MTKQDTSFHDWSDDYIIGLLEDAREQGLAYEISASAIERIKELKDLRNSNITPLRRRKKAENPVIASAEAFIDDIKQGKCNADKVVMIAIEPSTNKIMRAIVRTPEKMSRYDAIATLEIARMLLAEKCKVFLHDD